MEPEEQPATDGSTHVLEQQPVDRARRYYFTSRVVAYALFTSAIFTVMGTYLKTPVTLLTDYVDGMMGLANVVVLAYVSGSVIDYNGAISSVMSRVSGGQKE
jgi:phosphate/sulfate permease